MRFAPGRNDCSPRLKRPAIGLVALALAGGGLAGCGSSPDKPAASAGPISSGDQKLYDEAVAAGGKLSVFVGTTSKEMDGVIKAFNVKYPNVKVDYIGGLTPQMQDRLATEKRSGLDSADIFIAAGSGPFKQMDAQGLIEHYVPEDADKYTQKGSFVEGIAYPSGNIYSGACYNPNNVTAEEIKLLGDLKNWTDPRWKGRAAIIDVSGGGYRKSMTYWIYDAPGLGKPWLRELAKNVNPAVYTSGNSTAPLVIAGQYDVVFNDQTIRGARAFNEGAPIDCVFSEPATAYPFMIGLVKGAKNEAAGKLFENWTLSEDGQTAVQDNFAYASSRTGFDKPASKAKWWKIPSDAHFSDDDEVEAKYDDMSALFSQLFGKAKK